MARLFSAATGAPHVYEYSHWYSCIYIYIYVGVCIRIDLHGIRLTLDDTRVQAASGSPAVSALQQVHLMFMNIMIGFAMLTTCNWC